MSKSEGTKEASQQDTEHMAKESNLGQEQPHKMSLGLFDTAHLQQIKQLKTLPTHDTNKKTITNRNIDKCHKNINELLPD